MDLFNTVLPVHLVTVPQGSRPRHRHSNQDPPPLSSPVFSRTLPFPLDREKFSASIL